MTSILYGRSWRPGKHGMRPSCCLLLIVIGLVYPAPVRAQAPADGGPDPAAVRVRLGPLAMIPTMGLSNLGVDKNVFNDPPGKQPREDFTATLTPKTDLWLHVGGTWVTAAINEQITWYQKYASERSASNAYSVGWKLPLTWLIVNTNVAYAKVRDRPGFEVDARVSRKDLAYGGSVEGQIMSTELGGFPPSASSRRVVVAARLPPAESPPIDTRAWSPPSEAAFRGPSGTRPRSRQAASGRGSPAPACSRR